MYNRSQERLTTVFTRGRERKTARGKTRWGREREREGNEQSRRGNDEGRGKMGGDEIAKRREEYLNRDVALQVGVRPSGCRSSGELVEESTLQR